MTRRQKYPPPFSASPSRYKGGFPSRHSMLQLALEIFKDMRITEAMIADVADDMATAE